MSAHHRLAALTELSCLRALSAAESDELFRAHQIERLRQARLPGRIMRLRRELHRYEAELWPCYLDALRALEQADEAMRLAALERELDIIPKGISA